MPSGEMQYRRNATMALATGMMISLPGSVGFDHTKRLLKNPLRPIHESCWTTDPDSADSDTSQQT